MEYRIWIPTFSAALLAGCLSGEPHDSLGSAEQGISTTPQVVPGNPTCAELGLGTFQVKFDPPVSGTKSIGASDSVSISADGTRVDWTATIGIDAVIVKGGPNASVYVYSPESLGDTQLTAPINPNNGKPYGLSHVDFCFDWEVKVAKTANTSFKRQRLWSIDKTGSAGSVTLSPGETQTVGYTVTAAVTSSVDNDWTVAGTIVVTNPAPDPATLVSVTDDFGGNAIAVDCGVTFPFALPSGASLTCTYQAALPGLINGTNTATAATTGLVGPGSASVPVDFAGAAITLVDDCIDVVDDRVGSLGTVCSQQAPASFTYTLTVGPYSDCGPRPFANTASFTATDTGATGSDSWTVTANVVCNVGCTRTPGYWKNHPSDPTWALLPQGTQTPFFLSGATYLDILGTPPEGNVYYILGRAYAAAHLNKLTGASFSAAAAAFAEATTLLETTTPAQAPLEDAARAKWTALAGILDDYNNGRLGPSHCD